MAQLDRSDSLFLSISLSFCVCACASQFTYLWIRDNGNTNTQYSVSNHHTQGCSVLLPLWPCTRGPHTTPRPTPEVFSSFSVPLPAALPGDLVLPQQLWSFFAVPQTQPATALQSLLYACSCSPRLLATFTPVGSHLFRKTPSHAPMYSPGPTVSWFLKCQLSRKSW